MNLVTVKTARNRSARVTSLPTVDIIARLKELIRMKKSLSPVFFCSDSTLP